MRRVRIALIDPGTSRQEINEPIGIGALAAALQQHLGHLAQVALFFEPFDGLPSAEVVESSDVLGISTPLGSLNRLQHLVDIWRALTPDRRPALVLGGLLATFAPDDILLRFPEAVLVLGEGEEAFPLLVDAIRINGGECWRQALIERAVPNLVLRVGDQVLRTPRRNIELDATPAPLRPFLTEVVRQAGIARIEASRGCSYGRCTFCAIQHKYCDEIRWRGVPISRVLQELSDLSGAGARHPYFTDEDFAGDANRVIDLARAVEAEKRHGNISPELTLYVDMRAVSVTASRNADRPSGIEVLCALKAAGLREVFMGVESGAREQVMRYRKPGTTERNLRALEVLRSLDIDVDVGFIFFDPEMGLEEATENLSFLRRAGLWNHDARLTKELRLEAGTPLVETYRQKDLIAGPMEVDELTFPYRWRDSRVEAVHVAFGAWERKELNRVYALQAAARGEVPSEAMRKERRQLLGQIRTVELDALQELVDAAQRGSDPERCALDAFSTRRSALLDSCLSPGVYDV